MMTEVLEHLPYPPITIKEIHRILNKKSKYQVFLGSLLVDYNWHQRFRVFRGYRIEQDPAHIHSFSFTELDTLLRHYFYDVSYKALTGTASRYSFLPLKNFVRTIAWVAKGLRENPKPWKVKLIA